MKRVICDTHHTGGAAYYKDECPSCRADARRAEREEERRTLLMEAAQWDTHSSDREPME